MHTYIVLQNPGHNRVYFNAARALASHELTLAARHMHTAVSQIREEIIGGVSYLVFETAAPLDAADRIRLSRLSFVYALFERDADGHRLKPLLTDGAYFINGDISAMLKYTGKTNELFTRFMLTIAANTGVYTYNEEDAFCVLDPVCGKGTTLFECIALGYNAYGVEIDEKLAYETYVFLKRYMETSRYKHMTHTEKTGGVDEQHKKFSATRYRFELAKNKTDQKADRVLPVEIVAGDTRHMNTYYKKSMFHAIVGDLPYGVQHGSDRRNKPGQTKGGITRNAMGMLSEALPEWLKVLKRGGVIVLAWNVFLIPRHEMETLFITHGLRLPEDPLFTQLAHRVDQAIERDIIVGMLL